MKNLRFAILAMGIMAAANVGPSAYADSSDAITLQQELLSVAPKVSAFSIHDALPLEWERNHPERKLWSDYEYSVINDYFDELNMAEDIVDYCPNYDKLAYDQKIQAWAQLFVGVSRWESSWDPTERTLEGNDLDPETGQKVYSDGLLQMSYQDVESTPYCPFSWQIDKTLSESDPHRTIFNPFNNLYCGIRTMADAIRDNVQDQNCHGAHKIVCNEYWSTLDIHQPSHDKIPSIKAEMRNTLPFCGSRMKGQVFADDFTWFANLKVNREVVKVWRSTVGKAEDDIKNHKKKKEAPPAP